MTVPHFTGLQLFPDSKTKNENDFGPEKKCMKTCAISKQCHAHFQSATQYYDFPYIPI